MQRLLQLGTVLWMVLASWAQAPPQPQNPYYRGPLPQEEERYADSAPESLIPSVPWPEWLPSDLASLPGNPVQWTGQDGNSQGQLNSGVLEAISNLFGGPAARQPPAGIPGGLPGAAPVAPGMPMPMRATAKRLQFPKGDPRNCIKDGDNINIMQVVPGLGWDNLRNTETGMVTSFSYTQCKVTYDRMYLLPDQTFAIPVKTSVVERNSEFIENWDSYKSVTSHSINSGFDFFGKIGGKFSKEFLNVKSNMYNQKAIAMRMELRHRFHTIKQIPDSKLHPTFKNRVLDILSLLKSNDTRSADYTTQLLIRDYGTHYLTSVDAGAILIQHDNLKSTIKSEYKGRTNTITAAGGVEFFKFLSAQGGYSKSSSDADLTAYRNHITSSYVTSYGGPPYRIGMNVTEWELNLRNNLVAVDRFGSPIHSAISTENMKPEVIHAAEIVELKNLIQSVTSRYYAFNTHLGCTDVSAQNFDYQANAPLPGACKVPSKNYTFGGVFQTCSYISNSNGICGSLIQKNPITGGYRCPSGYDSVVLLSGTVTRPKTVKNCREEKKCTFFVFNCRRESKCTYSQLTEKARHDTFWCAPKRNRAPPHTGYLFGGIYSKDMNNPITRAKTCPNHYIAMKIGSNAHICLSEDYELGQQFSLPFGGFFSCRSGNKLATANASDFLNNPRSWPMKCPGGFTQHLALTEKNCRVNFCVKAGVLLRATDLDIVLPPFEPRPVIMENATDDWFEGVHPNALERGYDFNQYYVVGSNTTTEGSPLGQEAPGSDGRSLHPGISCPIGVFLMVMVALVWIEKN